MKMELIQPFINAADAVFAEALQAPTKIIDLSMDEEAYRRKGVAAIVTIRGDIEGRVILDLAPEVALRVAGCLAGGPVFESEEQVRETVCELANMVIGNSVTLLNDKGFRFKVSPPEVHTNPEGLASDHETEAMVVAFETPCGDVYLNISMHYLRRRQRDREAAPVVE
jgi:chemotaxis protein CheX